MAEIILVIFGIMLVRQFLNRKLPRVGGKIGAIRSIGPPPALSAGFSKIHTRVTTIYTAASDAARYRTLRAFLSRGTVARPILLQIYRVAGCATDVEIPVESPDYDRIDVTEALALLRELPDLRLISRLQLSDEPSFYDPWVRKVRNREAFLLGHSTTSRLVVLYRPDRKLGQINGQTLLHEWLHLVAFGSPRDVRRFKRANAVERLPRAAIEPMSVNVRDAQTHEAWCDLGEKIFGYDETIAREAALTLPVHTTILWQRIETYLRGAPLNLRSTRFGEFETRSIFIRGEVSEKAQALLGTRSFWRKVLS
jgi:hypothetical protein